MIDIDLVHVYDNNYSDMWENLSRSSKKLFLFDWV